MGIIIALLFIIIISWAVGSVFKDIEKLTEMGLRYVERRNARLAKQEADALDFDIDIL